MAEAAGPSPGKTPFRAKGIASLAILRPVGTLALASVVIVLGLFFAARLPVDLLPAIDYPQIRVTVNYPGVSPEVMEEQVTRVLERNLASTENLTHIDSRASQGRTNVNLHFAYGTNLDLALQDASRFLERARTQLPADIEPPRLFKFDPSQAPIWQAGFSSSIRTEVEVRDWIDNRLVPQLLAIQGVAGVEAAGGMVREMQVVVDQHRLRSYGLTIRDLVAVLERENVDIAGGWVTSASFDVMAQTDGLFTSARDIGETLIPLPGNDARQIRLEEVAEVRDAHRVQRLFARLNGSSAIQVSISKLPGANTVEVVERVEAAMARLRQSGFFPADLHYRTVGDRAFFIRSALDSVGTAALAGGVLAMLVALLFLGSLRKAFVIGVTLPIAIMATFAMMGAGGLTLNIISLGGLALGVGLLLDNAIVMLENIYRHRGRKGVSAEQAAHDGAREVSSAIIAGTLTNLAAVLPFLLITGFAALVFRELLLTISFAIVATLVSALTLVPMLTVLVGRLRFSSGLDRTLPLRAFDAAVRRLRRGYRRLLPRVLRWRWGVLGLAAAALAGAVQLSGQLGDTFLPQVDDGGIIVFVGLPQGTPPVETDAISRNVEEALRGMDHVETVFALVGGHLFGGIVNERPGTTRIQVQLVPAAERPDMPAGLWVAQAQERLAAMEIPGARIRVIPPRIRGLHFGTSGDDLAISIIGEDLALMHGIGQELVARLQGIPGLEGLEIGREDRSPVMRVQVARDRAGDLGLSVSDIGNAVRDAVDGVVPTRFLSGSQEYDVRVQLPREVVRDADMLGNLLVFRARGQPVLLRDVAEFDLGEGPAHIERENQGRIVRVIGDINTSVADVGSVMAQVQSRLADVDLPEQYALILRGQWETIQETNRELTLVLLLALFLVFVVLAIQYERLTNPLVILAAAPLGLVGVVAMLWATGTPMSAPVMIGAILLVGIVVNNAILLVEYVEIGRRGHGLGIARAVVGAGTVRLRPILMTTATTVLGMLPLAVSLGAGGEIMQPLALAVIGGLSVSMLLTLFVVPCLYVIVNGAAGRLKVLLMGGGGAGPGRSAAPAPDRG